MLITLKHHTNHIVDALVIQICSIDLRFSTSNNKRERRKNENENAERWSKNWIENKIDSFNQNQNYHRHYYYHSFIIINNQVIINIIVVVNIIKIIFILIVSKQNYFLTPYTKWNRWSICFCFCDDKHWWCDQLMRCVCENEETICLYSFIRCESAIIDDILICRCRLSTLMRRSWDVNLLWLMMMWMKCEI